METRNRIALILLDSTLEIGFKNYLIHEKGILLDETNPILLYRDKLHKAVSDKTQGVFNNKRWTGKEVWRLVNFYYGARCELYHEQADKTLTDSSISNFYDLVSFILDKLLCVDSASLTPDYRKILVSGFRLPANLSKLKKPIDFFVVAVAESQSKTAKDVKATLMKLGAKKQFDASDIHTYLFGKTYRHLFHINGETGIIEVTDQGKIRYDRLLRTIRAD